MEGITINIPVKPHLIRYILKKCKATEPFIKISNIDYIGFGYFFLLILSKKKDFYVLNMREIKEFFKTLDEKITLPVVLNTDIANRVGILVKPDKIYLINDFLEKQFRNEMMNFISSNILYNPRFVVEDGMEDYLNRYNISEDEIKKETLVKFYHRNKENYSYIV